MKAQFRLMVALPGHRAYNWFKGVGIWGGGLNDLLAPVGGSQALLTKGERYGFGPDRTGKAVGTGTGV